MEIGLLFIDGSSRMYFYMAWWGSSQDTIRSDTVVAKITLLKNHVSNQIIPVLPVILGQRLKLGEDQRTHLIHSSP